MLKADKDIEKKKKTNTKTPSPAHSPSIPGNLNEGQ